MDAPPDYTPEQSKVQVAYPPQQGYPPQPQQQAYPPQGYPQGYQQQPPPPMTYNNNNPQQIANDEARNQRRAKERAQNKCMAGMCFGGCFIALCVGQERAVACGTKIMDSLLCMDCYCGGF
eukprot:m.258527 g.258527  ORF g.258527 m.258527 type:complete len:121 (+) comp36686_c0_seq1:140-502(+)